MTQSHHNKRFPGESSGYRTARNALLQAELDLRAQTEKVAALRRELPLGGKVAEDYVFQGLDKRGAARAVKLSELFEAGKPSLIVYSFMYGPNVSAACPMCTSLLDGLNGQVSHLKQNAPLVVVAKSPLARLVSFAQERRWGELRLLSSSDNTYNRDYFAETEQGSQVPACNVFTRREDGIYHTWSAEVLYADAPGHPRHMDAAWPLWNLLDFTREGRGAWMPKLDYSESPAAH